LPFHEYLSHDACGLAELVRTGQVSPRELLDAAIERIEATNPGLNAVIDRLYDRARLNLERGLPDGPFKGVPFLLKDTLEIQGTKASFGSAAARHHICSETHELARRLEAAGLVIVGRTNMSEIGLLPTTEPALYGSTKNPWNPAYSPGGSSGGAAAAVASGMVPMAHADDGGGSIRIPASACGLFGLKPSRGRNPGSPRDAPLGFIQTHCVSRSVRDSATLLDATHGALTGDVDFAPPPTLPYRQAAERDPSPLRIAFMTRNFSGTRAHPDCTAAVENAARLCEELGHRVTQDSPRIDGGAYNDAFLVVWGMSAGYFVKAVARAATQQMPKALAARVKPETVARGLTSLSALPLRNPPFERFTRRLALIDRRYSPADVWLAAETLQLAARTLAGFFENYDLLLTPVLGEPPWKLGTFSHFWSEDETRQRLLDYVGYTPICNTSGFPAMSVPVDENAQGLPIGVQFIAPFAQEQRLFALAGQLERARPWASRLRFFDEAHC